MSLFKKESRTHFIRDSSGKVIKTESYGDEERHETVFDRAAIRRQSNKDVRVRERNERRYERRTQKEAEREAQRKAYNEERLKVRAERGRRSAHHPITAMLPPRRVVHVHVNKQFVKKNKRMSPSEFQRRMMKGF